MRQKRSCVSTLSAKVGTQGGRFDFDVPASIPPVEDKPAEKKADDAKPADTKTPEKAEAS
jgi:hypothetical protein